MVISRLLEKILPEFVNHNTVSFIYLFKCCGNSTILNTDICPLKRTFVLSVLIRVQALCNFICFFSRFVFIPSFHIFIAHTFGVDF